VEVSQASNILNLPTLYVQSN